MYVHDCVKSDTQYAYRATFQGKITNQLESFALQMIICLKKMSQKDDTTGVCILG